MALFVAVLAAYGSPATDYEPSIYAGTPHTVWIALGLAFAVTLTVGLATERARHRRLSLLLGGISTLAVVGLPLLRSYRYYGTADAMTHLGWVRDLSNGVQTPFDLFYPGLHTSAVLVSRAAGWEIERSILTIVVVVSVALLVFVPLAVRAVTGTDPAVVFAAVVAFMLLPINTVSTHPHAHPFTQTALLSAALVYLVVRYVRQSSRTSVSLTGLDPTAIGALLALFGVATIVYHPQQAANLIVLFVGISLAQLYYRRRGGDHPARQHRPLYAQTAFLLAVFLVWSQQFNLVLDALDTLWSALSGYLAGDPPQAAESVQRQGDSLTAIGSGLLEIFVKLFLVSAVYSVLAGGLFVASMVGALDDVFPERNLLIKYLGIGMVALVPLFAAYLLGSVSEQYFRHFGFLMVLVTILGSLALGRLWTSFEGTGWRGPVVGVALAAMLALSLIAVFPSPYIYSASQHVTDEQLSGYETIFEHGDEDVQLVGIRQGPWRLHDGIVGVANSEGYRLSVPDDGLVGINELYDDPRYLAVSDYDRAREVTAYRELRYTERGFDSLDDQSGVSRVQANGQVDLYYVQPREAAPRVFGYR